MIKEVIVVEGKDDINAVKRAVDAEFITTSGMGLTEETLAKIEAAHQRCGIIIFTDPDFPGQKIRSIISQRIPEAKHAYLTQEKARCKKTNKIGIEYAQPEDIREALKMAKAVKEEVSPQYTTQDLWQWGLMGVSRGGKRRQQLADLLGIGKTNGKQFLRRLNSFNIPREEIEKALLAIEGLGD